jgi:glyoxylase-like metal-dependent hydrolase (beta-lactamase superfamily II)
MTATDLFIHPFCFPELEAMLEQTGEQEILPGIWLLEGNMGLDFFLAPPSSNIFLLRDNDLAVVFDTGLHPYYRPKVLSILEKWRKDGAKTLVLLNSQGHWDHVLNNEVVLSAGYDQVRFLLPEPEVPVIESIQHWLGDLSKLESFYDPYTNWAGLLVNFEQYARTREGYDRPEYAPVWAAIKGLGDNPDHKSFRAAIRLLSDRVLMRDVRSLVEQAEVLPLAGRERRRYGDAEVMGWPVGRFFLIHDGSHSPGHICLYDPQNRLVLAGDVTIEINPAFFDTSMTRLISAAGALKRMSEQGFVELVGDSHRNPEAFGNLMLLLGVEPLHATELNDVIRGREDCAAFFRTFEDYYVALRDAVLEALIRLGRADLLELVAELSGSSDRFVRFKMALPFPSRPEVLVARILDEEGCGRVIEGGRTLFLPSVPWRFQSGKEV